MKPLQATRLHRHAAVKSAGQVDSSDPGAVTRFNVRAHYYQRLVLTASVCRELSSAGEDVGDSAHEPR